MPRRQGGSLAFELCIHHINTSHPLPERIAALLAAAPLRRAAVLWPAGRRACCGRRNVHRGRAAGRGGRAVRLAVAGLLQQLRL